MKGPSQISKHATQPRRSPAATSLRCGLRGLEATDLGFGRLEWLLRKVCNVKSSAACSNVLNRALGGVAIAGVFNVSGTDRLGSP